MPTWGQLLVELQQMTDQLERLQASGQLSGQLVVAPVDVVRRKYLAQLAQHSGRDTIIYATRWLEPDPPATGTDVSLGDVQGFMEACSDLKNDKLDLIVTSPGGSPDAAESIMGYLRTRFKHIRIVVPVAAMSAATMMALATDEIVMGSHSQLGPIDPQFTIHTPEGPRSAPGQAIIDQFELAKEQCQDPANLAAWVPILRGLAPGLLAHCAHARELAENNARTALATHMFAGDPAASAKANQASSYFSDFGRFKSHGRRVSRDDARANNLKVTDLESDNVLQDLVLSVHHATRITFAHSPAVKIIENQNGRASITALQQLAVQQIVVPPIDVPPPPVDQSPGGPQQPNRAQRRAGKKQR